MLVCARAATGARLDSAPMIAGAAGVNRPPLGVKPCWPAFTWGAMVADGRNYLSTAWWLALWPGLSIMLTTLSLNLLSNWMRVALDPAQRWRLEARSTANG